jgi:Bbp16-like protein
MYLDAFGLVSDSQAITATAASTHTIDLGNVTPKRAIGDGEEVGFAVNVEVAADFTTGNETYTFEVIQSANANLSSPDVIGSITLTAAQLLAGFLFFMPILGGFPTKRYVGMQYTVGGTTPTITISAWLTPKSLFSRANTHYARAYTV